MTERSHHHTPSHTITSVSFQQSTWWTQQSACLLALMKVQPITAIRSNKAKSWFVSKKEGISLHLSPNSMPLSRKLTVLRRKAVHKLPRTGLRARMPCTLKWRRTVELLILRLCLPDAGSAVLAAVWKLSRNWMSLIWLSCAGFVHLLHAMRDLSLTEPASWWRLRFRIVVCEPLKKSRNFTVINLPVRNAHRTHTFAR